MSNRGKERFYFVSETGDRNGNQRLFPPRNLCLVKGPLGRGRVLWVGGKTPGFTRPRKLVTLGVLSRRVAFAMADNRSFFSLVAANSSSAPTREGEMELRGCLFVFFFFVWKPMTTIVGGSSFLTAPFGMRHTPLPARCVFSSPWPQGDPLARRPAASRARVSSDLALTT